MSIAGVGARQFDLSITIADLNLPPRAAIDLVANSPLMGSGLRHVQLNVTRPGLRPRELDASGRRDLLAALRRRELAISGLDAWVPPSHLIDPQHTDRAVAALVAAVDLAGDLGRVPLSVVLPPRPSEEASTFDAAAEALIARAEYRGVTIADHAVHEGDHARQTIQSDIIAVGVDPAAVLSAGRDPAEAVHRAAGSLASARLVDLHSTGLRGPVGSGDGRLDVLSYKVALSVSGFAHPVVIDSRQWHDPWAGVQQSVAAWQSR